MSALKKIVRLLSITLVVLITLVVIRSFYRTDIPDEFVGGAGDASRTWPYTIDAKQPCWLRLQRESRPIIRVNCFAIDGVLYTHSSRTAPVASWFGRSWIQTAERHPEIEVLIEGNIYRLQATKIAREPRRREILKARYSWYIPDGISVYRLEAAKNAVKQ